MLYRIWKLTLKELIQLVRDRLLAPFVLLGPLTELLMIAWSTSQGIEHLPTAVLDLDRSAASRGMIAAMINTETFDPYHVGTLDQVTEDIHRGRALAAWTAAEVAGGVVASYGQQVVLRTLPSAGVSPPLEMSLRVWFNEEMKESNYMIPSELGFIAAAMVAMVASMAIARERELGTLEQLMVTPIRTVELVVGKSVVAVALGYTEFLLMLGLVVWGFDVPLRGSLPLLMGIAFFYMLVELGWGLMVSAVARTQMQALLITFAVVMVMVIFCGYAFPVETMPPLMQVIANVFPLKHWMVIFRGILLKGAGVQVFWPEMLAIVGLGAVIYTGTVLLMRRTKLE
jgi:ABC-2 type transport system permease protein